MTLTVGSLFAGIGAFDLGFGRAGMRTAWHVELDADARRVLHRHWPDAATFNDVRAVGRADLSPVDVVCGGFPCQDLSVAGLRAGLGGDRSGLWWEMLRVICELRPGLVVWENVPGLASSDRGRDFVRVVSSLAEHGYFGCVRTLDAQHFGVPQRRRRLFGVFAAGRAGAGLAAEILAIAESGGRHPAAGRPARPDVAATVRSRSHGPGVNPPGRGGEDDHNLILANAVSVPLTARDGRNGNANSDRQSLVAVAAFGGNRTSGPIDVATAVNACKTASGRQDFESETFIVGAAGRDPLYIRPDCGHPFLGELDTITCPTCGQRFGSATVTYPESRGGRAGDVERLMAEDADEADQGGTVALQMNFIRKERVGGPAGTLASQPGNAQFNGLWDRERMIVRRLMPVECCRLQGFPDDWLDLDPPLSDSAKYRMLGNAVAVPCAEYIGRRIVAALGQTGGKAAA